MRQIVVKFCTDIYGTQRMNTHALGDPFFDPVVPTSLKRFPLSSDDILNHLLHGWAQSVMHIFMDSRLCILILGILEFSCTTTTGLMSVVSEKFECPSMR